MWKILRLAFAVLALATTAQAKPPTWTVRDADSEMVLFGSVHILPSGLDWKPDSLTEALSHANDVWFEIPLDRVSEAETARLALETGVLPPGQTLSAMMKPNDRKRLVRVATAYGASMSMLERLEPWFAEVALAEAAFRKSGGNAEFGVEQLLVGILKPAATQRAFETPAEQISLFDGVSMSDQIASLNQSVRELEARPLQYKSLVDAWMAGDVRAIDREAVQPLKRASPEIYKRFLTDRNSRWLPVLRERLAGSGRTVVVVGVGHLVGPEGLPARLRALGYSVEGP